VPTSEPCHLPSFRQQVIANSGFDLPVPEQHDLLALPAKRFTVTPPRSLSSSFAVPDRIDYKSFTLTHIPLSQTPFTLHPIQPIFNRSTVKRIMGTQPFSKPPSSIRNVELCGSQGQRCYGEFITQGGRCLCFPSQMSDHC
jgi:hypothetical protein